MSDRAKCFGQTVYALCEKRTTCRRFLEAPPNKAYDWYVIPMIPGPCAHYIDVPAAKPPGERLREPDPIPVSPKLPPSPTR